MIKKIFLGLLIFFISPLGAFADCIQEGTSSVGDTAVSVAAGNISYLDDFDTGSSVRILSSGTIYFWYTKNLGDSVPVTSVTILGACQTEGSTCAGGGGDSGYTMRYSNSPLGSGNIGTACDSSFSMTGTASTYTFTCSVTAQYWGLYRNGNFTGTSNIANSFDITGTLCDDGGSGTTTNATSTADMSTATVFGFAWVIFFLSLIFAGMWFNKVKI